MKSYHSPTHYLSNSLWLIIFIPLLILPYGKLYNPVFYILSIWAMVYISRRWRQIICLDSVRIFALLFLCWWVPMLLSLTNAINLERSAITSLGYIRFFLVGVFFISLMQEKNTGKAIFLATTLLSGYWGLDAIIQIFTGVNTVGFPYESGRITGMFYPKLTLGIVLAALAPVYFEGLYRLSGRFRFSWLLVFPYIGVILYGGSRASWLMLIIAAIAYIAHLYLNRNLKLIRKKTFLILCLAALTISFVVYNSGVIYNRVTLASIEHGIKGRLDLWETAGRIWLDNPVVGVGPRGYRYAAGKYSDPDDKNINPVTGLGQTHPHGMLAEVATETGITGLLGMLLFWYLLVRYYVSLDRRTIQTCTPWLISVLITAMPINAHKAFYGSFYSTVFWWLLSIAIAYCSLKTDTQGE